MATNKLPSDESNVGIVDNTEEGESDDESVLMMNVALVAEDDSVLMDAALMAKHDLDSEEKMDSAARCGGQSMDEGNAASGSGQNAAKATLVPPALLIRRLHICMLHSIAKKKTIMAKQNKTLIMAKMAIMEQKIKTMTIAKMTSS